MSHHSPLISLGQVRNMTKLLTGPSLAPSPHTEHGPICCHCKSGNWRRARSRFKWPFKLKLSTFCCEVNCILFVWLAWVSSRKHLSLINDTTNGCYMLPFHLTCNWDQCHRVDTKSWRKCFCFFLPQTKSIKLVLPILHRNGALHLKTAVLVLFNQLICLA